MLEKIVWMERERISALESRDSVKYFELCNELGIKPEAEELYEFGEAEKNFQKKLGEEFKKRWPTKYEKFLHEVSSSGLDPYDIFSLTDVKKRILRNVMNYRNLWGKNGKVPLNKCSDARIGSAFKRVYETALNKSPDFR